jgi:hypothetical protein
MSVITTIIIPTLVYILKIAFIVVIVYVLFLLIKALKKYLRS